MSIEFFKIAANLKTVPRQGWIDKLQLENPESVADHTFLMAIIAMYLSDLMNVNSSKVLKLVLIHDLAESVVGDITPNKMSNKKKIKLENQAIRKIFSYLPSKISKKYLSLWREYQENTSKEAILVHEIDKLEMALQAKLYQENGVERSKLSSFYKTAKKETKSKEIRKILTELLTKN